MQLAGLTFERLVGSAFQVAPDGVGFPRLTSRGIVGGVRHVLFMRMLESRERELYTLTDEVLDWIESYRIPAAARSARSRSPPAAHAPPAPAAFLAPRRQALARARRGRAPDARRGLLAADRPADRAVRRRLNRGLPQAVRQQGGSASSPCSTSSPGKRSTPSGSSFERADSWPEGVYLGDGRVRRLPVAHAGAAADRVHRPVRGRPRRWSGA